MAQATTMNRLLFVLLLLSLTAGAISESFSRGGTRHQLRGLPGDIAKGLRDSSVWENEKGKPQSGVMRMPDWSTRRTDENGCEEKPEGTVTCAGQIVKAVPQDLNQNITSISFVNTSIQSLPDGIFEIYTNLEQIEFMDDHLSEISKGAFRGISNLTVLTLDNNRLVDTSFGNETFQGLSSLQSLYLDSNRLTRFPTHVIANATNLNQLLIYWSDISEIGPDSLPPLMHLRKLDLAGKLTSIDTFAFRHTPNLLRIDFTNNKLHNIPTKALNLLSSLKELVLGDNEITVLRNSDLEGAFTKNLENLDLSSNKLNISTLAFVNLQQLRVLDLTDCDLTYLNGNDFIYKPHLQILDIGGNPFRCDCHAAWMVEALEQGKVWAKKWTSDSPFCSTPHGLEFKGISDLYPQDFTCSRPYIQARTPTYVNVQRDNIHVSFSFELQALMLGGYPHSTWVFPDGYGGRADDKVNASDHSVITTLSTFGRMTGLFNYTLIASNVGGDSNLTFWVHLTDAAGAPTVSTVNLLLMLTAAVIITG